MDIRGEELIRLLTANTKPIQLRSGRNMVRLLCPAEALQKAKSGRYVGVGSPRRVRHLRCAEQIASPRPLDASCFTRRLRNDGGELIASPVILEHKRLWKP